MTPDSVISSPQIVALAGALAHAGKHREAAVLLGHVVDEFHDDDGLAHAGAAEEADLAALQERLDQVDDLDAGLEHLFVRRLLVEQRRGTMDGHARLLADRAQLVHRLADHVDARGPASPCPPGTRMGPPRSMAFMPRTMPSVASMATRAHAALAQVLLHFENDVDGRGHVEAVAGDAQRLVDGRHRRFFKLHVHRGTGNLECLYHFCR